MALISVGRDYYCGDLGTDPATILNLSATLDELHAVALGSRRMEKEEFEVLVGSLNSLITLADRGFIGITFALPEVESD